MTGNTGLLTARCDPFGAESRIQLLGGMYDESYRGKHMWHCAERAVGRYRMICTGGDYGYRAANDAGLVSATHCDGGHRGQAMHLCATHVAEFSRRGDRAPVPLASRAWDGAGHEQHWAPGSQVGGTKANELCPACAYPPEARELSARADFLHQQISGVRILAMQSGIIGFGGRRLAAMESEAAQVSARLDELNRLGIAHKCPLILREVS